LYLANLQGDDSGTSTPVTAPAATEDLDFSDIKKKKKPKKAAFDLEAFEKELKKSKDKSAEDDDDDEIEHNPNLDIDDAGLEHDPFAQPDAPVGIDAGNEPWLKSDRDYTYQEVGLYLFYLASPASHPTNIQLLARFYSLLHAANPALLSSSSQKRYTIAPPSIHREGNKKSIFANVSDICKKMHRQVCPLSWSLFIPVI
jgi:translation initiation factor 2 subunit 2